MDTRVQALAERFELANLEVRGAFASATDEDLARVCPAEECTLAALGCHIASVHETGIEWMQLMLDGREPPTLTMADIDRINRAFFAERAKASRTEVLALLEHGGERGSHELRKLHDADLDHSSSFPLFGGAVISVQTLIEQVLIGDPVAH